MGQRETSRDIDDAAAEWVARNDRGNLTVAEQSTLDTWLEASALHRGAYAKAQSVLAVTRYAIFASDAPSISSPVTASTARHPLTRRGLLAVGGIAAAAAVAFFAFNLTSNVPFTSYETKRGELRSLPLEDGTVVTLDTASKIAVRYRRAEREVRLIQGKVLFDVAKDSRRPFTVTAGNTVVRAIGTSFVVQNREDKPVQVLVREGAVDMFRQQSPNDQPVRVPANSRAVAIEVPVPSVKLIETSLDPSEVARQLAWRQGMISFEGTTLQLAAEELNRYSDVHIVVDDPTVASRTVTGLFSIHNPVGFARSVAVSLNLKIQETPTSVMLWE